MSGAGRQTDTRASHQRAVVSEHARAESVEKSAVPGGGAGGTVRMDV